jgi:two-component system chemotaxis response regulator CheB
LTGINADPRDPRKVAQRSRIVGMAAAPYIVAVGASAGGVEAVIRLLARLPGDLPAIVLVVVHRHKRRSSHLQSVIRRYANMPVVVPSEGERLHPGVCYLGSMERHLTVGPGATASLRPAASQGRSSIDTLFLSLARHAGPRTIALVLSGLLDDGARGLAAIREAGGVTLVQDPNEAAFKEMPQSAIDLGPVDCIAGIEDLARQVCRLTVRAPAPSEA